MRIAQEEIFGPVVCVIKVRDEEEAIAVANDSIYGLAGASGPERVSEPPRSRAACGPEPSV